MREDFVDNMMLAFDHGAFESYSDVKGFFEALYDATVFSPNIDMGTAREVSEELMDLSRDMRKDWA